VFATQHYIIDEGCEQIQSTWNKLMLFKKIGSTKFSMKTADSSNMSVELSRHLMEVRHNGWWGVVNWEIRASGVQDNFRCQYGYSRSTSIVAINNCEDMDNAFVSLLLWCIRSDKPTGRSLLGVVGNENLDLVMWVRGRRRRDSQRRVFYNSAKSFSFGGHANFLWMLFLVVRIDPTT